MGNRWLVVGVVAVLLAYGAARVMKAPEAGARAPGHAGTPPSQAAPAAHPAAPDVAIQTASGERHLKDLRGKVVLLDFWATWCPPCREAMPRLQKVYQRYHNQGFEVIGVSLDDDKDAPIADVVKETGVTYPAGHIVSMAMAEPFSVQALPTMVLVDKNGGARWTAVGIDDDTENQIDTRVQALLKEP